MNCLRFFSIGVAHVTTSQPIRMKCRLIVIRKITKCFSNVLVLQHTNSSHKPVLGLQRDVRLPAEAGEGRDRVQRDIGMRGPRAPGASW
jgi:hypothetical protein